MLRAGTLVLLILFTAVTAAPQEARRAPSPSTPRAQATQAVDELFAFLTEMDKSHSKTVQLNEKMSAIYFALSKKIEEVGKRASGAGGSEAQLVQAIKQLEEMQRNFNLQYLQLQNAMQNENRQFTMVSNIMKTKHDTVKNSINNIR